MKANMDYETLRNSMTVEDAVRVLRDTNCFGTMDIAKNVILKALDEQASEDEKVIRISKGTLKARTGRYVIYDVEWLKTHFNTKLNGDYISRKEVLKVLHSKFADGFDGDKWWNSTVVLGAINEVPSTQPHPTERTEMHEGDCNSKKGHWIMPQNDDGMSDPIYYQVRCSECNFDLDPQTWHQELHQYGADKYCPQCGAKMEVEK